MYTEFLLKNILSKENLFDRLLKWAIELEQSDIKFLHRALIKGQVLANFMAEFIPRAVSPEQVYLVSAHSREERSVAGPFKNSQPFKYQSALG